jgi:hypothetical protein
MLQGRPNRSIRAIAFSEVPTKMKAVSDRTIERNRAETPLTSASISRRLPMTRF